MPRAASMLPGGSASVPSKGAVSVLSPGSASARERARVRVGAGSPLRGPLGEIQRARLLAGAVVAIDELGYAGGTVGKVTGRARVSRRTFYELFANLDECLAAVLADAVARVERELNEGGVAGLGWRERVRVGLAVILGFLDREPALARVCVVQALRAGPVVQECREGVLARLVAVVDEGRSQGVRGQACSVLTGEGLVGAALAIVQARIAHPEHRPLSEQPGRPGLSGLLGELMGMIVLPYLGPAAARRERERKPSSVRAVKGAQPSVAAVSVLSLGVEDPLQGVAMRLTYRTARVLEGVRELSGDGERPSNRRDRDVRRCRRPRPDLKASTSPGASRADREPRRRARPRGAQPVAAHCQRRPRRRRSAYAYTQPAGGSMNKPSHRVRAGLVRVFIEEGVCS